MALHSRAYARNPLPSSRRDDGDRRDRRGNRRSRQGRAGRGAAVGSVLRRQGIASQPGDFRRCPTTGASEPIWSKGRCSSLRPSLFADAIDVLEPIEAHRHRCRAPPISGTSRPSARSIASCSRRGVTACRVEVIGTQRRQRHNGRALCRARQAGNGRRGRVVALNGGAPGRRPVSSLTARTRLEIRLERAIGRRARRPLATQAPCQRLRTPLS